ncbi:MAG: hypothetical protein KDA28_03245, partial [Phycisphaerales bacterium]|nr:hypothetical protein [Phycisphaerales bacterium]
LADGDPQAALAHYVQFRDRSLRLHRALPEDMVPLIDVVTACDWIGRLRTDLGDVPGAIEAHQQAVDVVTGAMNAEHDPRLDLAFQNTAVRLAELRMATGDLDGAATLIDRLLASAEATVEARPALAEAWRNLGVARYKRHELARLERNDEVALQWLQACRDIFEEAASRGLLRPSDADVLDTLDAELDALRASGR